MTPQREYALIIHKRIFDMRCHLENGQAGALQVGDALAILGIVGDVAELASMIAVEIDKQPTR